MLHRQFVVVSTTGDALFEQVNALVSGLHALASTFRTSGPRHQSWRVDPLLTDGVRSAVVVYDGARVPVAVCFDEARGEWWIQHSPLR